MAAGVQGTQHTGTHLLHCSKGSAAQAGRKGKVGADHGGKLLQIMPCLLFRHGALRYHCYKSVRR